MNLNHARLPIPPRGLVFCTEGPDESFALSGSTGFSLLQLLSSLLHQQDSFYPVFFSFVPKAGIEPARCCHHWILNPARLPVPPLRQVYQVSAEPIGSCIQRACPEGEATVGAASFRVYQPACRQAGSATSASIVKPWRCLQLSLQGSLTDQKLLFCSGNSLIADANIQASIDIVKHAGIKKFPAERAAAA